MNDFVKKVILHHWQYKLAALLAAVILWSYVASDQNLSVVLNVPVEFNNFPSEMKIINKVTNSVDLSVTGRRDIVNNINKQNVKIVIDMKKAVEGKNSFRILPQNIKSLPRGLDIRDITPYQIGVELEKIINDKPEVITNGKTVR